MRALIVVALALVVGGLYLEDVMSEASMGAVFGLTVVLVGCWSAWRALRAYGPLARDVRAVVLVTLVAGVASWPVVQAVFPTNALVSADFHEEGDAVMLTSAPGGEGRLLVLGRSAGSGASKLTLTWNLGDTRLYSHLHRDRYRGRVGRRRATMVRDHSSEFVRVSLPDRAATLRLAGISGGLAGDVHAALYRNIVPFVAQLGAAAVVWLLTALVGGYRGNGPKVAAGAGAVLVFGLMAAHTVTPYAAFKPELGALFVGVFAGGFGGAIAGGVIQRLVPAPNTAA